MKNLFKLSIAAILLVAATQINAQIKFGPKVGLNIANQSYSGGGISLDTKSIIGFHIGGIAEISLMDNLVLQPGVLFSIKGTKVDMPSFFGEPATSSKTTINYLEIPINAMYKIDMGALQIVGFAGPYLGYAFSGKNEDTDIEFGSGDGEVKALDFGLNFGAGVEISNIQLTAQYGLGLSNLSNASEGKVKNGVIAISAAYLLGGK